MQRILKNLPQKISIKQATETIGEAFKQKPCRIKKFYKDLESREAKIIAKKGTFGSLSKKQFGQLFKDVKEKSGFFYSKTKAQKAINKAAEAVSGESMEDKKQKLIKYGKKRTIMAERLKNVKTGRLIDSKQNQDDPMADKKNEKIDMIRNIKINAIPNQNQNNSNANTDNSYSSGWTNKEQKSGLSDNSKEPKKDAPQKEQPIDMFID